MIEQTVNDLTMIIGTRPACRALGASPATIYRRRRPPKPRPSRPRAPSPRALSELEREAVLAELHSERFVDSAPAAVWATLLDEGRYLASERTMYRLLAAQHGTVRERRAQLTHPPYAAPELLAERPRQVIAGRHPHSETALGELSGRGMRLLEHLVQRPHAEARRAEPGVGADVVQGVRDVLVGGDVDHAAVGRLGAGAELVIHAQDPEQPGAGLALQVLIGEPVAPAVAMQDLALTPPAHVRVGGPTGLAAQLKPRARPRAPGRVRPCRRPKRPRRPTRAVPRDTRTGRGHDQ